VTLTPSVFNAARNILFLVSGADKAEALAAVLTGPSIQSVGPRSAFDLSEVR
jgi:6-phosphogluconolactonase/glucosamine-6-phosphate isomerase/deaminase